MRKPVSSNRFRADSRHVTSSSKFKTTTDVNAVDIMKAIRHTAKIEENGGAGNYNVSHERCILTTHDHDFSYLG